MTKTLPDFMAELDAVAANSAAPASFWETIGVALQIWRNGVPAAEWDPRVNAAFAPIYAASKKFGAANLRAAVDARVFA